MYHQQCHLLFYHQVNLHQCVDANMQHSIVILRSYVLKSQSMCRMQTCKCKLLKMPKNLGLVGGKVVTLLGYDGKCFLPLSSWDRNYQFRPTLFKESRPRFNSNQAFLLVQKLKSAPKGFTLRVKVENRKNLFNLPQVTNKCWTLWLYIGPKAKKG